MNTLRPRSAQFDRPLESHWVYTRRGWPILPCNGKVPIISRGVRDATTDPVQIGEWLAQYPLANIAVATGSPAPVALDVDRRHGGEASLAELIKRVGVEVWDTLRLLTGGGGIHLLFTVPANALVGNSVGKLGLGLDVRGSGGYLIVPPSRHRSGEIYHRDLDSPDEPAPMPPSLLQRIQAIARTTTAGSVEGEAIQEGRRNASLTSLAGAMRRRGMTAREIGAALHVVNEDRCIPPLDPSEVDRIAASVARYPARTASEQASMRIAGVPARSEPKS